MTMLRGTFRAIKTLAFASSLLVGLSQTACEKKRGLRFTQGSGENIFEIKSYDSQTFKLKTGQKRFKGQTSRADELQTLNGFDKINNLDAVEFTIDQGLFADIDMSDFNFYGRENFEYTFSYSFTDYYVILSKVAEKADIPSQELTFAKDLGNGKFEVPMMGLPISLFTVEQVKDERGKATRQVTTFPKDYLAQATHFKINAGQVKYFDAPAKPDLFAADFFNPNDEWFFTKTLVGRSIKSKDILGDTKASLKIKFAKTNNSLIGVDLNIAKEQEVLDPTKTITALEIPVQWVDFKTDTAGSDARLKETALGDKEGGSRFWKERKYALIDFNNADRLDKAFTLDNKLEKLEVSNDYISFTIYESSSGNTYKYSLAKENRKIDGQTLFAADAKRFHFFTQRRSVIHGELQSQESDIDKIIYASRFYPENNEIVYHISKNSPKEKEFTEAVAAAMKAWDNAFKEAGTNIHVRLSDERVDLGDVRYNAIVLYGYEIDAGNLMGFGPSVQDTRNGETFSAATHIYLRTYREGLISNIRNFIRNELGLYEDKSLNMIASFQSSDQFVLGGGLMNTSHSSLASLSTLRSQIKDNNMFAADLSAGLEKDVFGSKYRLDALDAYDKATSKKDTKESRLFTTNGPRCDYAEVASVSNSWAKIREACATGNTKFSDYLARLKTAYRNSDAKSKVMNIEGEEEAILECAQPLMKDLLTSTLIHEVGHNLGLGHNFAGSSDTVENHAKNDDGTEAYPSSSVMDYPDRDFDLYNKAGPYDVAAIRFLYGRKVETTDKKFIDVPKNSSITAAAAKAGVEPKSYRMCTDYEVDLKKSNDNLPTYDPMCSRWDVGSTPQQYVKWAIAQIHADLIQNGYRFNNKGFYGASGAARFMEHFRQIQQYFRYLVKDKAGVYLEKLGGNTPAEAKAKLKEIVESDAQSADPQTKQRQLALKNYYEAVELIFNFASEAINLPSRTCVLTDKSSGKYVDAMEFAPLRQRIYELKNKTIQSCQEAEGVAAEALKDMGKSYAGQLASIHFQDRSMEVKGLELDLNPEAAADKWKEISFVADPENPEADLDPRYSSGTSILKTVAMLILTNRTASMILADEGGVGTTSFLDYPWFADKLYRDAMKTILSGTDGSILDPVIPKDKPLQHYQDMQSLTPAYLGMLYKGSMVSRSPALKYARSLQPKVTSVTQFEEGPGAKESPIWSVNLSGTEVLYADSGFALEFLKLFVQLNQQDGAYFTYLATNPKAAEDQKKETNAFLTEALGGQAASLTADEKQFQAALALMAEMGLADLQPAQRLTLRTYLADATKKAPAATSDKAEELTAAQVAIVTTALNKFAAEQLINLRLLSMDPNDSQALQNTLVSFLSTFGG